MARQQIDLKQQRMNLIKRRLSDLIKSFSTYFAEEWKLKPEIEQELLNYFDSRGSHNKEIRIEDYDSETLTIAGAMLNNLGEHDDAIAFFDKAILIYAEFIPALLNKGYAFSRMLRYEDAIISYDKILQLDPNHYQALLQKGLALQCSGRREDAIVYYSKAIAVKPEEHHLASANLLYCKIHRNSESTKREISSLESLYTARYN